MEIFIFNISGIIGVRLIFLARDDPNRNDLRRSGSFFFVSGSCHGQRIKFKPLTENCVSLSQVPPSGRHVPPRQAVPLVDVSPIFLHVSHENRKYAASKIASRMAHNGMHTVLSYMSSAPIN